MSFDLTDYVDVAERERQFFERYPEGRIQVDLEEVRRADGEIAAWKAKATVWRDTEDPIPVVDFAVEPVPGRTPYTKDSEAMNASTSAVGRAIVLAGFPSKHIASANEVRARQDSAGGAAPPATTGGQQASSEASPPPSPAAVAQAAYEANRTVPTDDGKPENVVVTFGQKWKGKRLGEVDAGYLKWLDETYVARSPEGRRVQEAARMLLGTALPALSSSDDDIPFSPVPV